MSSNCLPDRITCQRALVSLGSPVGLLLFSLLLFKVFQLVVDYVLVLLEPEFDQLRLLSEVFILVP